MKFEVKLDESLNETIVLIRAPRMNSDVETIIKRLGDCKPKVIAAFHGEAIELVGPEELIRIYGANQQVYAVTERGEYKLRLRLYEVEERLQSMGFLRISNSEIVNLKKIKGFDMSFAGTMCVRFLDGTSTFASRRYVAKIKKTLGL